MLKHQTNARKTERGNGTGNESTAGAVGGHDAWLRPRYLYKMEGQLKLDTVQGKHLGLVPKKACAEIDDSAGNGVEVLNLSYAEVV